MFEGYVVGRFRIAFGRLQPSLSAPIKPPVLRSLFNDLIRTRLSALAVMASSFERGAQPGVRLDWIRFNHRADRVMPHINRH